MDEQTANALRGWIERTRNERCVSAAVYDGRVLVGELATTDPDVVVALVRDVVALAGKAWGGRVVLRDASGAEVVGVPVRVDVEPIAKSASASSEGVSASIGAEGLRALTDALKQAQAQAHAFATLQLQTTKELAAGASSIIASTDKALVTMAERASRADLERAGLEDLLKQAIESAREANDALDKERAQNRDFVGTLVKAFGPQVRRIIEGMGPGAPGPVAAIQEATGPQIQEEQKPS